MATQQHKHPIRNVKRQCIKGFLFIFNKKMYVTKISLVIQDEMSLRTHETHYFCLIWTICSFFSEGIMWAVPLALISLTSCTILPLKWKISFLKHFSDLKNIQTLNLCLNVDASSKENKNLCVTVEQKNWWHTLTIAWKYLCTQLFPLQNISSNVTLKKVVKRSNTDMNYVLLEGKFYL